MDWKEWFTSALTRSMNLDRHTDESSLLLSASRVGRNEIVGSLLDANPDGIDVNAKNYRGEFALLAAAENGHLGVARTLLQHGAKVNMAGPKVRSTIKVKIWKEVVLSQVDGEMKKIYCLLQGQTPLHAAAARGTLAMVKLLLDHNASPRQRDGAEGSTRCCCTMVGQTICGSFLGTKST